MECERLNMTLLEFSGVYLTRYGNFVKAQADFIMYPTWLLIVVICGSGH
jgi:hypothetical protein